MTAQLRKWQRPEEMQSLLDQLGDRHGFHCLEQGEMKPWREAFCAHAFAGATGAVAVKLGEDRSDDFWLRVGNEDMEFQLAEAYRQGRRRTAEFKNLAQLSIEKKKLPCEHYDPTEEAVSLPTLVRDCVKAKAEKNYSRKTRLAVYADVQMFPALEREVEAGIRDAVSPYAGFFRAIWVLIPNWKLLSFLNNHRNSESLLGLVM